MSENRQRATEALGPTYSGAAVTRVAAALDAAEALGRAEVAAEIRNLADELDGDYGSYEYVAHRLRALTAVLVPAAVAGDTDREGEGRG